MATIPLGLNFDTMMARIKKNQEEFLKAILSVMEAALSMHANNFVHSDIRWQNIIFDSRYSETYMLIDFENINEISDANNLNLKSHATKNPNFSILDAAYIMLLFNKDIIREECLKWAYRKIVTLADYLESFDTRLDRIEESRSKIRTYFWELYEKKGKY